MSLVARGEVHLVDREVDPRFELAAVVARAQKESDRAILFRNVRGSSFPVVANVYGSFSRMAELVNAGDKGLNRRWLEIFETLPAHSYDYIKQVPVPVDLQTGSLNDLPRHYLAGKGRRVLISLPAFSWRTTRRRGYRTCPSAAA